LNTTFAPYIVEIKILIAIFETAGTTTPTKYAHRVQLLSFKCPSCLLVYFFCEV